MGFLLVLKAEVVRSLITMRRYWLQALTGILIGYGMLIALIWAFTAGNHDMAKNMREKVLQGATGAATQSAPASTTGPEATAPSESSEATIAASTDGSTANPQQGAGKIMNGVLGFVIGIFAFGVIGMFSQGLAGMAQSGELEQLCMSPHGLIGNFLARSLVTALSNIVSSVILVTLVSFTVDRGGLHYAPFPTVVLLALTFANLLGFGFMVGGLVLVFKQTGQIAMLIRLALLTLPIAASENVTKWPLLLRVGAHIMPITDATICLKLVLLEGRGSAVFMHPSFAFLIVNCAVWTTIGIACFRYMEDWSRDKGTLGAY